MLNGETRHCKAQIKPLIFRENQKKTKNLEMLQIDFFLTDIGEKIKISMQ